MNIIKRASYTTNEYAEILVDGKVFGKILPNKPVNLPDSAFTVSAFILLRNGSDKVPLFTGKQHQLEPLPAPKRKPRKKVIKDETA